MKYIVKGFKDGKVELEPYHQYVERKKNPVFYAGEPYTLAVPIDDIVKAGDIMEEKNGRIVSVRANFIDKVFKLFK